MIYHSRQCVLCGKTKPLSEFADRGRANKTFACIDCLNRNGKNIEGKKAVKVKIDPRKLFEGDSDLRQYLKIEIDLDKFFNLADNQRVDSWGKIKDIEIQSTVRDKNGNF